MMAMADDIVRPLPPYSGGISAARNPASVSARTNVSGYARSASSVRQYSPGNLAHSALTDARTSSKVSTIRLIRYN